MVWRGRLLTTPARGRQGTLTPSGPLSTIPGSSNRVPSAEHQELTGLLDYHRAETAARSAVHDYLAAAERHVKACESLQREAEGRGVHISEVAGWPEWCHEAQRLEESGRTMLADEDTYGGPILTPSSPESRAPAWLSTSCAAALRTAALRRTQRRAPKLDRTQHPGGKKASPISSMTPRGSASYGISSRSSSARLAYSTGEAGA